MGIKGLTQLIQDEAPKAIKQHEMKAMFGRKIAIDASMSIYQFLIAVRQQDGQQLQTESGDTTSHLLGLFQRTIRMCDNGIKPLYVFDGKPPQLKSGVLAKRFEKRDEAQDQGEEAKETGTVEDMDRASRRTVRVTREHNEECRRLLKLMGIPYLEAPSEAEAQCAELCRGGVVYAAGSEDMDTLTFGTPVLLRHLTFSEARKMPIDEIRLSDVLSGLDLDMNKFIDFCILCGCDYLEPLKKMGAKTAINSLRKYEDLEGVLEHLREHKTKKKDGTVASNAPPEDWPYEEARQLFRKPEVHPASECHPEWNEPDLDGLLQFLVNEKGFSEDRVRKGAEKLRSAVTAKQQGRLESFFKAPAASSSKKESVNPARAKRLAEEAKEKEAKKKSKKNSTKKASSSSKKAKKEPKEEPKEEEEKEESD